MDRKLPRLRISACVAQALLPVRLFKLLKCRRPQAPSPAYLCICGTGTPACAAFQTFKMSCTAGALACDLSLWHSRPRLWRFLHSTSDRIKHETIVPPILSAATKKSATLCLLIATRIWRAPAGGKIIEPILKASVSEAGRVGRGGKESSPGGAAQGICLLPQQKTCDPSVCFA